MEGRNVGKYCNVCADKLGRCARCGTAMPVRSLVLRWENVGNEPLVLTRDRCCDLYDHVFLKGPDGKLAPARQDNRARLRHAQPASVRLEPGRSDEEPFDPWFWVVKPEAPGEYTLWVEFEQSVKLLEARQGGMDGTPGKGFWTGKVRSNEVKVTVGEPAKPAFGEAKNGLRVGLSVVSPKVEAGKPIELRVMLRNEGKEDISLPDGGHPSAWKFTFQPSGADADPERRVSASGHYDGPHIVERPPPALALRSGETRTVQIRGVAAIANIRKVDDSKRIVSTTPLPAVQPGSYRVIATYAPFDATRPAITETPWQYTSSGSVELEIQAKDVPPKPAPPEEPERF